MEGINTNKKEGKISCKKLKFALLVSASTCFFLGFFSSCFAILS